MTKIIGFMKKHDPRVLLGRTSRSNKKKGKDGDDGDDEEEADDEKQQEEEEGDDEANKKKEISLAEQRKKRKGVDARIYARAQELLESGEITDEWIAAAMKHIGRVSEAVEDTRRTNIVFALNEEPVPSMRFPLEDPERTIKRPKNRPAWSYVLSPPSDLPPKTPRALRAEAKQRKQAKEREQAITVDEEYIKHYFVDLRPRAAFADKEHKKIDKERKAAMLSRNKETGEPLVWTDETTERLGDQHVKRQRELWDKYQKQLDKEAQDLQKSKKLEGQQYHDMVTRVSEEYVDRKKQHREKTRRELDKEFKGMFVPAINHPARDGTLDKKEQFVMESPPLSKEKVAEVANRLSTDFVEKKKVHMHELEEKLSAERSRFLDEQTKAMYEAQNRSLTMQEQKDMAERLAVPISRFPAPR